MPLVAYRWIVGYYAGWVELSVEVQCGLVCERLATDRLYLDIDVCTVVCCEY
jgi:hypothetical protein